jgi:hypothetical protein
MKHLGHVARRMIGSSGLLLAALFMFAGVVQASGTGWSVVSSPNPSTNGNVLQAVAAVSTNKVWTVGYYFAGTTKNQVKQTLIERYNGTKWSVVPSPNVGTGDNTLNGVAAISGTNAWSVGSSPGGALILHFNGTTWSVVPNTFACALNAVAATSASNVWAAGTSSGQTCMLHFNGSTWTRVQTPNMGVGDDTLSGVTAISSTDAWAVGTYCTGDTCDRGSGTFQTLIIHYHNGRWGVVPSPNPDNYINSLNAITAISATNLWAVGNHATDPFDSEPLILHFDGTSWTQVASPALKGNSGLAAIAAASATDIYAVGAASIPTAPAFPTLIEHFDGTSWSIVSSPSPGVHNALNGIAHVPNAKLGNAQFWGVGTYDTNAPSLTLTERDI